MKNHGKVAIGGIDYDILSMSEKEEPRLDTCFGYHDTMNCKIVLDSALTPTAFRSVLIHELMHAIFERSGLLDFVAAALSSDRNSEKTTAFEEQFIRIFIPHLISTLGGIKKLK